jgi:hypothetical protein
LPARSHFNAQEHGHQVAQEKWARKENVCDIYGALEHRADKTGATVHRLFPSNPRAGGLDYDNELSLDTEVRGTHRRITSMTAAVSGDRLSPEAAQRPKGRPKAARERRGRSESSWR